MAVEWTDPITVTAADFGRAADWNTYVRDNLLYLYQRPSCKVRRTSAQGVMTVQDSTLTTILWGEDAWDTHADMWASGSPGVVTLTRAGIYLIVAHVQWDSNNVNKRSLALYKNDGATALDKVDQPASSPTEQQLTVVSNFAANDYIDLRAYQTSGAQREIGTDRTDMAVTWLGVAA